tara:strand:+ start:680 stop:838 length:159 start_codon:yes stop_codon:yes gene_type:complete
MLYIILFLLSSIGFSEDFYLEDLNLSSDYYGTDIGPSSFPDDISIVYFGHYN